MKTRFDNLLARLKGRTWNGLPAEEYLYIRLQGEDGEAPWLGSEAAKLVSKKLKVRVTEQVISKWLKRQVSDRRHAENYELMLTTTLSFIAERSEMALDLGDMVDAQIVMMIGRIHSEDGAEEAIKATTAFTKLKQAITAELLRKQRVREFEESVDKLKAKIESLCKQLKKAGGSAEEIDKFNHAAVKAVDDTILRG